MARVVIKENAPLPGICCTCGTLTDQRVTISHSGQVVTSRGPGQSSSFQPSFLTIFLLGGILGRIAHLCFGVRSDDSRAETSMQIKMPQCNECMKEKRVQPETIYLERFQMAFIVHRSFAEKLKSK